MFIEIDRDSDVPLFEQIYQHIKRQILNGEISSDEKLPSKRQLQNDLSVSMTTVESAYDLLLGEDLIYSRPKSGFYTVHIEQLQHVKPPVLHHKVNRPAEKSYTLPLGTIDTSIVQSDVLKQIAREIFSNDELLNMGDESGEKELKEQIRHYLHINRGVNCSLDQIFIGPSTEFLLEQVLFLLKYPAVTIEDPGYPVVKNILRRLESPVDYAPILKDGIDVAAVQTFNNQAVHLTPSHQFPSGVVLSLKKRIRLLNHASAAESYIIEDDYDSEFRYTARPLPSLQGLDKNDRTVYMSSFSKSLYPSLRLACMVLPQSLAEQYFETGLACNVPRQMQHIIAEFMKRGYLDRHVNRVRKIYREKMMRITEWIKDNYEAAEIYGEHTGMHFMLRIPGKDLRQSAERYGLVHGNSYSDLSSMTDTVLIGIGEKDAEEIVAILKKFFESLQGD